MMLYFAYGSNMSMEQMMMRCPTARAVATAQLRGWRLCERKYADIERKPGERVDGVLYSMRPADFRALDRYEGRPRVYERRNATVWANGFGWVACQTYVMTPAAVAERDGESYPDDYRARCSAGARDFGIRDGFARAS